MDNTAPHRGVCSQSALTSGGLGTISDASGSGSVYGVYEPLTEDDLLSRTIMRWPVSRRLGSLRTREWNAMVGRDLRVVRASLPLEDMAASVADDRPVCRLAAGTAAVGVKQ